MHDTAYYNCQAFFDAYAPAFRGADTKVVEIGSQDICGSIRECCPSGFQYTGVDFVAGKGVDVVLEDPYRLPFETDSVDIVLSSSCFEHSEMFWVLFLEILRILKPEGLFYLNAPSNGDIHRHPVDCWRFYPDCGHALVAWAKRNGTNAALLESYTSYQVQDQWNDYVAVFVKSERSSARYPARILEKKVDIYNGLVKDSTNFINASSSSEDKLRLRVIKGILTGELRIPDASTDTEKLAICRKILDGELRVTKAPG